LFAAGAIGLAATAHAHTGHEVTGFVSGLVHPFGLDHLLAMVAVGLWSVTALRKAEVWRGPLAFMLCMLIGTALGGMGLGLPQLEAALSLTVVALGAWIVLALERSVPDSVRRRSGLVVIVTAGVLHGIAHGAEAPLGQHPGVYVAGMLCMTGALHIAGVALGLALRRWRNGLWQQHLTRGLGAGLGVAGLLLWAAA
jgi:urease accessory protein